MNLFVARRSLLFFIATWVIAVALSADGIDLDDLFPGNYVVHDDDDNPFGAGLSGPADGFAVRTTQHQAPHQGQTSSKKQNHRSHQVPLQVVYDQDSPSLASDPLATHIASPMFLSDDRPVEVHQFSSGEPLHLLLRVLLI